MRILLSKEELLDLLNTIPSERRYTDVEVCPPSHEHGGIEFCLSMGEPKALLEYPWSGITRFTGNT